MPVSAATMLVAALAVAAAAGAPTAAPRAVDAPSALGTTIARDASYEPLM